MSSNTLFRKKLKFILDIQRSIDIDNKFDPNYDKNLIKKKINSMKKVAFIWGSGLIGSEVLVIKKNLKVII